ncbi:MAG: hypothetical protein NVS9B8_16230 [Candidatus Limnocylindrales bacterium]
MTSRTVRSSSVTSSGPTVHAFGGGDRGANSGIGFVDAAVLAIVERLNEPSWRPSIGATSVCCDPATGRR